MSYPDVVEGVGGVAWVVHEAVSSIVALREGDPKLGVNVLHELSSIMHRLDNSGVQRRNYQRLFSLKKELLWRNSHIETERCILQFHFPPLIIIIGS